MTQVIKISKAGFNVLSESNINNYIFDSRFNTFKVIKEGTAAISYTSDGAYTINHGASISSPSSFNAFFKFPDGYTVLGGGVGGARSRDTNWSVRDMYITTTQIKFDLYGTGSSNTIYAKYYIYETPL